MGVVGELFTGQDRLWIGAAFTGGFSSGLAFVRYWIFAGSATEAGFNPPVSPTAPRQFKRRGKNLLGYMRQDMEEALNRVAKAATPLQTLPNKGGDA